MGRKAKAMVGIRDGKLVVMVPAGELLVFGPKELGAAAQLSAAITPGVVELGQRGGRDRWLQPLLTVTTIGAGQ